MTGSIIIGAAFAFVLVLFAAVTFRAPPVDQSIRRAEYQARRRIDPELKDPDSVSIVLKLPDYCEPGLIRHASGMWLPPPMTTTMIKG